MKNFILCDMNYCEGLHDFIQKAKALELERSLEDLNEQLSSARTESNAKDDVIAQQAKVAEEAIAGIHFLSHIYDFPANFSIPVRPHLLIYFIQSLFYS